MITPTTAKDFPEWKLNPTHLDDVEPRGWYGGTKMLECDILVGAYNGLDLEAFIGFLKTLPWKQPDLLQLFVKEENDDVFRIINVFNIN